MILIQSQNALNVDKSCPTERVRQGEKQSRPIFQPALQIKSAANARKLEMLVCRKSRNFDSADSSGSGSSSFLEFNKPEISDWMFL
jgi:hypothetical protein